MALGRRSSEDPNEQTPADNPADRDRGDEGAGVPPAENPDLGTRAEARPISEATDGVEPSIREEIRDLPDDEKPDPTTIAQEEVLVGEGERDEDE
jgi:hypothetical protein